jgi:hypothetical protein
VVLPLPGTRRLVAQRLQQHEVAGLALVSEVACNPFQRSAAQKALKTYLQAQTAPLHLLYKLLADPDLNTYVVAPVSKQDWERMPTTGHLLLGELAGQWVDCIPGWFNRFSERLIWYLTRFRRDRGKTPLTRFARMLYRFLDEKTVNAEGFDLGKERPIYARLTDYPGGVEIERSFEAMASFLSYKQLSDLPKALDIVGVGGHVLAPIETAIRPTVLKALHPLRDIASEVRLYSAATSRVNKQAALLRATDALKTLDEYVTAEVVPPEQTILQRIIRQWSDLIIEEGGEVGRDEIVEPVANPYVVGNPVTGDLFVGREDIMRRLEELWMVEGQRPSVVLYGHRRMGKSSILHNLGASLGSHTTVVDFNMQRVGLVDSTEELLYIFAIAIYDALPVALQDQLEEPNEEKFTSHNLDRFLKKLDQVRAGQRFIITIDEFELIEQLIEEKRLEPRLLDFWRGLIQTYPWFVLAFAGLHTLQEMTHNYWNPLFGSVTAIPVSFLSPKAAERLITQPSPDFNLDYDTEAIAKIIQLTNGQPYLVQLVGHTLVTRFNRQMFEEGIERERRFTLEDVNAVINTPEFYRDGNAYFSGVWVQAENSEPPRQTVILEALCQAGLSVTEIAENTGLSCDRIQSALLALQRHDVIKQQNGQYVYTVELMRRWVAPRTSGQQ